MVYNLFQLLCLLLFFNCCYGDPKKDAAESWRSSTKEIKFLWSSDTFYSDSCYKETAIRARRPNCHNKRVYWDEPQENTRLVDGVLSKKTHMNVSSCQEFCLLTENCRGVNFDTKGTCILMAETEKKSDLQNSISMVYHCCEKDNVTCTIPNIRESRPVCPNKYIQWLPMLRGVYTGEKPLGVKLNATESSCKEFCYETPGCVGATLRTNRDCSLVGAIGSLKFVQEQNLLTYQCCKLVNGSWSEWSEFSLCDEKTNVMTRTRKCNNPMPSGGGSDCSGSAVDSILCHVNGSWSEWSEFSPCDQETNVMTRTRKCNNPQPVGNGSDCQGSAIENIHCDDLNRTLHFSYSTNMRQRAENTTHWWNMKAILCSSNGEFVINWNEIGGTFNWTAMWYDMVKYGESDGLHAFIMLPEQGKGRFTEIILTRSRSYALIQTRYSGKTSFYMSPTVMNCKLNITFFKQNGTSEVVSQSVRNSKIFGIVSNDLVKLPMQWNSLDVNKLPIITLKLTKLQTA